MCFKLLQGHFRRKTAVRRRKAFVRYCQENTWEKKEVHHLNEQRIHVTIDGISVEVPENTTIFCAAEQLGIDIPHLCYLKGLMPEGSCRMCVVEVLRPDGIQEIQTACTEPCYEGLVIETNSPKVVQYRKTILEMLMTRHKTNCFSCPQNGRCPLQSYCRLYGVEPGEFENPILPKETENPFFTFDPNLCIMCRRCQRTCAQVSGREAISLVGRGYESKLDVPYIHIDLDLCESCGNCVEACPTSALSKTDGLQFRDWEVTRVRTTCPHCAVGCQMDLLMRDGHFVGVEGADGPTNHNRLCVKGRFGSYKFIESGTRLTDPLIKDRATGTFRKASWDEALDLVASRFTEIKNKYGGGALAGFACSRSTNEDIYMLQKMVRTVFGSNNTDNCARV